MSDYNYDISGNRYAYFYPIDSAYYDNVMSKSDKKYKISTFADFKKIYSVQIGNNMYRTETPPKRK